MQRCLSAVVVVVWLVGGTRDAAAQDAARAVIEKAVKAYGGEQNVAKLQVIRTKMKGTVEVEGKDAPFQMEQLLQLPDKVKNRMVITIQDTKITSLEVFDGVKGWTKEGEDVKPLEGAALVEMKATAHGSRVEAFLPLLQDKGFTLSLLDSSQVEGKPVVGVNVAYKGYRDIKLYFDKETGLLARTERLAEDEPGKPVSLETFYSDYKDFDGVKQPVKFKMRRGGKKYVEGEVTEIKFETKLPANEFDKP